MLGEKLRDVPTEIPGVYCFYDLDDTPVYVGQSSDIRSRLRQHLVRQDSSVVSYGRLDIWDLSRLEWWETSDKDIAEEALVHKYSPYLNFEDGSETAARDRSNFQ
jgi:excinuclease UvrABC nuclease subunit